MGKVIIVASGKGGVGKTTLCVNLAATLAKSGKKVLIADMNVGLRNDDIYLGLEDRILFDLGDVTSGVCKLEKAIVQHDLCENLFLLSCPQYRDIDGMTSGHIRALYAKLKKEFDLVFVDCPVISGSQLGYMATGVDEALVVITQDYVSIRNGDTVNRKLAGIGIFKRSYVVNMLREEAYGMEGIPDIGFISKAVSADCLGFIPYDMNINLSNNNGTPVVLAEETYINKTFENIANQLV